MSFKDRIRDMIYTSPSGKSFTVQFDDLSRSGGKKAPVTESPGADGGTVQDLGKRTTTYPVRCYLTGQDYDLEADRFWDALLETGPGFLNHPRWGNIRVLPNPRTQTEEFVNGAGRAVFEIDFITAPEDAEEYPTIEAAPDLQIAADADTAASAITDSLDGEELTDPKGITGLKDAVVRNMARFKTAFASVSAAVDGLQADIEAVITSITNNIDDLVTAPADLMTELLQLYRLPARTVTNVQSKIEGYSALYSVIIDGFRSQTLAYGEMVGLINTAQANAIQAAAAEATIDGAITTRGQAADIIDTLNTLNANISTAVEAIEAAGGFTSDYASRAAAEQASARAISNLVDRALNLPTEKRRTLDRSINPLALVYELYSDIDNLEDTLSEFIAYNRLTGNEILTIPNGREVRWYE